MADGAEDEVGIQYPPRTGTGLPQARYIGQPWDGWRDAYHYLLTMPLWRFFAVMGAGYLAVNAVFALGYLVVGGVSGVPRGDFAAAFFFSAETLSTVGYGQSAPQSLGAHVVVTVESFVGLFELAIATGLLFARISRPTARVVFSDRAVVAPLDGVPTLMLRAANRRRNRIVEAEVTVTLVRDAVTQEGETYRRFQTLEVARTRTPVFVLTWTIMHPIDAASPLFDQTTESLKARHAEILVVVRGLDETFAQTIHARASYQPHEIVWGRQLAPIFTRDDDGVPVIDFSRFHDIA